MEPESIKQTIEQEREREREVANYKWLQWRKRVASRLPVLAASVFKLRRALEWNTTHTFANQQQLEYLLGLVITNATGSPSKFLRNTEQALSEQIAFELDVEDLHKRIKQAHQTLLAVGEIPGVTF